MATDEERVQRSGTGDFGAALPVRPRSPSGTAPMGGVNVHVDYCLAEAHWLIGAVERRNAVLRSILEKLISDCAAFDR